MAGGTGYALAAAMRTFWQDLALAARLLRKNPGFTFAAVLTLALGIGANTTIFSFADALLLRRLPVPDADRIVHIFQRRPQSTDLFPLSYADYLDYRRDSRSFEALAAHYHTSPMHVVIAGDPFAANGAVVTSSYFDVLKLRPALGRFFTVEEDTVPDRDAVAVISDALWERRFGRAADVLGQSIRINDRPFAIVGVAPRGFVTIRNGDVATDVWIPTAMFRIGYRYCNGFERSCTIIEMLGRLKPDVTIAQAQNELDVIAARLSTAYASNRDLGITVIVARGRGYSAEQSRTQAQQLRVFVLAVGLVLLIGCANVAGLLLARAIQRRKEIAVRLALGATRGRLVRQLLTESTLVALLGAVAGLLIAFWGKDFVGGLEATDYAGRPRDMRTDLSAAVLAATAGITIFATLLFGVIPALLASRPDVVPVLKDEGSSGGATRARLRQVLVVGQIALAVTLLIGAGLLIRSVDRVLAGPGFDPRPVITIRLRPLLVDYPTAKALAFQRDVLARLQALPGVIDASPADGIVTSPAPAIVNERARTPAEGGQPEREHIIRQTRVGPRYFATLGVPLVEGREFDERDNAAAPKVAVINDVLAHAISPTGGVTGRTVIVAGTPHQIVGVVKDAQYYVFGQAPHAVVYRAYWQPNAEGSFNKDSRTIVRVSGDAAAMMPAIRRAVAEVDAAVPMSEDYPLSQRVRYEFLPIRRARTLLASLAALALFLSAVGLYSVLAFAVAQRTREIGVRIALGAGRGDVARLVLREGMGMALGGTALGIAAGWMSAQLVAGFLYGVDARDAAAFTAAPIILAAVAVLACYFPARRAARVSPIAALKYE